MQDELENTVKQENATRWNSLLTCLVSVLKTWDSLTRCLENCRQCRRILCIDKSLLIEVIDFLTVFQTATLTLEAFKTPTIHLVAYQRHLCSLGCNPRLAAGITCRRWLQSQRPDSISGASFSFWVKNELHNILNLPNPIVISESTAVRWMHVLGMSYKQYKRGIYNDGHERPDVVTYRESFLQRMQQYAKRMPQYEGEAWRM